MDDFLADPDNLAKGPYLSISLPFKHAAEGGEPFPHIPLVGSVGDAYCSPDRLTVRKRRPSRTVALLTTILLRRQSATMVADLRPESAGRCGSFQQIP